MSRWTTKPGPIPPALASGWTLPYAGGPSHDQSDGSRNVSGSDFGLHVCVFGTAAAAADVATNATSSERSQPFLTEMSLPPIARVRSFRPNMSRSLGALLALSSALALAGAATAAQQHFFFAPGVTTSCEMDFALPKIGTAAYCQT